DLIPGPRRDAKPAPAHDLPAEICSACEGSMERSPEGAGLRGSQIVAENAPSATTRVAGRRPRSGRGGRIFLFALAAALVGFLAYATFAARASAARSMQTQHHGISRQ